MKTRMEKYYDENQGKRVHKNEKVYEDINKNEISQFDLNSNVSVIGDSKKNIDVDALKDILDKKYNHTPKRKSIVIEDEHYEPIEEKIVDEKKEYDINAVLEKARSQKKTDYEEERLKRAGNINFEDLNYSGEVNLEEEKEDDQLMTLINTIASNENSIDPLDMFSDLKGGEDTVIVEGASLEEYEKSDTKTLDTLDNLKEEIEEKVKEEAEVVPEQKIKNNKFDDSFYTSSMKIKKKDFAKEDDDIAESTKGVKILITVLSVIAIIILIVGILLLLNSIFDWNLLDYFRK